MMDLDVIAVLENPDDDSVLLGYGLTPESALKSLERRLQGKNVDPKNITIYQKMPRRVEAKLIVR